MGGDWAAGHGIPIRVDVIEGQLVASNGMLDLAGFAGMVFADPIADSAFMSAPQNIQITSFPGYDINGMQPQSNLFLEPLGLPVRRGDELATRVLWYWSAQTQQVEAAPNDPGLRLLSTREFGEVTLGQWGDAPGGLRIAEPLTADLGEHRHLVYYILNDSPPAAHGVYAFFATLSSPEYNESDPLLVALNYGLGDETFVQGALAINQAALTDGDYDRNGAIEPHDYDVWRQSFGSLYDQPRIGADGNRDGRVTAADYVTWRNAFAASVALNGHSAANIPEPASCLLSILAGVSAVLAWRCVPESTRNRQPLRTHNVWRNRGTFSISRRVAVANLKTSVNDQGTQQSTQDARPGRVLSPCSGPDHRRQIRSRRPIGRRLGG